MNNTITKMNRIFEWKHDKRRYNISANHVKN